MPIKVLFLCIHNSARSQMAAAYLKKLGGAHYEVESAGLNPGTLNPLAVEVMKEDGIDISHYPTNDVFKFHEEGKTYRYVITVCDEANAERCPTFPGTSERKAWSFADPSLFKGTWEERLEQTRRVRDAIKQAVENFVSEKC